MSLEHWTIMNGDSLTELKRLEKESIQTVVTSPPYWGLRDYGTADWDGGDKDCEHKPVFKPHPSATVGNDIKDIGKSYYRDYCKDCGAKRIDDQIGIESTPKEYVQNMVNLFKKIRRVLKKDGTVWLNLGDSYIGGGKGWEWSKEGTIQKNHIDAGVKYGKPTGKIEGLKPKDLAGIPWRVAFALQEDGWWLRSDIIWHKPNPMPESVTDRPTKSHEYIFLLTKSKDYYYDQDAIRDGYAEEMDQLGRNKRDVWTVNTKAYPQAHFAVYPERLILDCIKAGSKEGDIVLDPFSGSGTTGRVACKNNRFYIGIELNPDYAELSKRELARTVGASVSQAKDIKSPGVQLNMI